MNAASAGRVSLGARERRLLLAVIDVRGAPLGARASEIDWPAVEAVARDGKILPTLAHRVVTEAVAVGDARVRERLREVLQEIAVHNTRLLAELARVVTLLRAARIDCVALKGAVLMARHYPHLAMRQAVDLDLLIDPERFDDAVSLLRARGYADAPHTAALGFDGRSLASALRAPHLHAHTPLCGRSGVNLDLHRRVPARAFDAGGGFRGWLARSEPTAVEGVTVAMCERRDLALHLCEHFALQHHGHPHDAPRLLCDLRVMFDGEPDWSDLSRQSPAQHVAVAVVRALYRAAFEPDFARSRAGGLLRRIAVADPSVVVPLAALSTALEHAERFARDGVARPRYALRKLLPAAGYMQERYGVKPDSPRYYARVAGRLLRDPLKRLTQR